MIIFDKPYVSDISASYAAETKHPVLDNAYARELSARFDLNLMDEHTFAKQVSSGKRLYATSENALDWIYANIEDKELLRGIRLMKDKFALRTVLRPMYPQYLFRQVSVSQLCDVNVAELEMPFILKPSVGFFSVGVYTITNEQDWRAALADIEKNMESWKLCYPASVIGDANFLIESFIEGDEYAVDVYFDDSGEPVILNIMQHEFSSGDDVKDRLYMTSKNIISNNHIAFTHFFAAMNRIVEVKNFPAHIELRVMHDGTIIPIECNPIRFSGWCTNEIAYHAFGIRTYEYYLENRRPDWDSLLAGKDNQIFSMILLEKPAGIASGNVFYDYDTVQANFSNVLELRRMEKPDDPMFAFVFAQTPADDRRELDRILRADLSTYARPGQPNRA